VMVGQISRQLFGGSFPPIKVDVMAEDKNEEAPKSQFHEPPDWVKKDPVYTEEIMRESARYHFKQRVIAYQGCIDVRTAAESVKHNIMREAGANSAKATMALNGLGAIALLAFLGNVVGAYPT
jgi:hypothetical protein